MKPIKVLCLLMIFFLPAQILPQETGSENDSRIQTIEENEIKHVVEEQYIKGLQIRDFEFIRMVCIPKAKLMGVNKKGKLNITTLDKWAKKFDPKNPPFKKLDYEILKIDREGIEAQVKVKFLINSKKYVTDYLNMLRIEGRWKIVNIIDF